MHKLLFIALAVSLLVGCTKTLHKAKTLTTTHKDSSYHVADTSKMVVTATTKEVTHYGGDSLTGSVYLPIAIADFVGITDSVESNGLKVKVHLTPFKGGFKARINAVSKPVETEKTTAATALTHWGVSNAGHIATTQSVLQQNKHIQPTGLPWGWIVAIAILALLAMIIYYLEKHRYHV